MRRLPAPRRSAHGLIEGAEPFSHGEGPVGVLLVHGFTSTPYDVRALGSYLADRGFASEGVLLPGHGTSPADLAQTSLGDWLRGVREGMERLEARCEHVFALGISLSGNFLLTLAPLLPFAGLILVGTPLRFRHERAFRAAYRALRALGVEYQRKWYVDHLDADIRARRPTYTHFPLTCAPECFAAIKWSRVNLPRIHCPVLILQSTSDHAVDERTLSEFRTSLASPDVTVRLFENRYHVLLIDHGADDVFAEITHFVRTRARERTLQRALATPAPQPVEIRV